MLYFLKSLISDVMMRILPFAVLLAFSSSLAAAPAPSPVEIVASAPASAWKDIPADDLLIMTLADGRTVVIQLATGFSAPHLASVRALAKAHWWDGTSVYRIQDNYVAQWGDRSEKKPLPDGLPHSLPESYVVPRPGADAITALPYRDSYAAQTGFIDGWPVGMDGKNAWLVHCYGMVGAGRNLSPDAGNGAELYAVIGQSPRQLDRNIALLGRVVDGMDALSSLPRGTGEIGMYGPEQTPTGIVSVRLASDIPQADRPHYKVMDTRSASFAAYVDARANRRDPFYNLPAGGADICNVPVPVQKGKP